MLTGDKIFQYSNEKPDIQITFKRNQVLLLHAHFKAFIFSRSSSFKLLSICSYSLLFSQRIVTQPRREMLREKLLLLGRTFIRPSLLILFLAGSIRNAGGYVWAYNTQPYFNKYYPQTNVGEYMSWIPLVGGSLGVVLGGFISDRLIKNRGFYMRVWVLIFSQVCVKDKNSVTRKGFNNSVHEISLELFCKNLLQIL